MTITLTERDDNSRIQARVGDTLEVRLPEIASAGYRWSPDDLNANMFELKDAGAEYPAGGGSERADRRYFASLSARR